MHKIDSVGNSNNQFVAGNPEQGILPTRITPEWLNAIQGEIAHVITQAGVDLNKPDNTQLAEAIAWYVAQGGSSYTHPSTHSASIITETADKKIFTAAERLKLAGLLSAKTIMPINFTPTAANYHDISLQIGVNRVWFKNLKSTNWSPGRTNRLTMSMLRWLALDSEGNQIEGNYFNYLLSGYSNGTYADAIRNIVNYADIMQENTVYSPDGLSCYVDIIRHSSGRIEMNRTNLAGQYDYGGGYTGNQKYFSSPDNTQGVALRLFWHDQADFDSDSVISEPILIRS